MNLSHAQDTLVDSGTTEETRRKVAASVNRLSLKRGESVGRYLVVDGRGRGGMGEVYSAYDPQLDRRVAIKVLRPALSASLDSARLLREAQSMAKVSHPNVVAVFDVGQLDERVFIAMELVEGPTLRKWLRAQERSWKEIRDVFVGAAAGLAAAHEAGFVHRDFKPGNVMIDKDGRARVLDFGLARTASAPNGGAIDPSIRRKLEVGDLSGVSLTGAALSQPGTISGTPAYMAPEALLGEFVGAHADQFSFCVALFEAFYGRRPFAGKTAEELLELISEGSLGIFDNPKRVPTWMLRAIKRGLSFSPSQRFDSMDQLVRAMNRDRRSRRRQWIFVGVIAVGSATAAASAALLIRPQPTAQQRSEVEELTLQAREAASKANFVYPPPQDPAAPTAYQKVVALRDVEGAAGRAAREQADALSEEFADTLIRLGDKYWPRPGGAPFAADFYLSALVFRPDNDHALERVSVSAGQLALLTQKARTGEFTRTELLAVEPLAVLAVPDQEERARRLEDLLADEDEERPASSRAQLEKLHNQARGQQPTPEPEPEPEPVADEAVADTDGTDGAAETGAIEVAEEETPREARRSRPDRPRPENKPAGSAKEQVEAAKAAFRAGRLSEAEQGFHRALDINPRNTAALIGLSELYFQRSAYDKAIKFANKAVQAAPKNAGYRIQLGDGYYKALRYADARREYEKAAALGSSKGEKRLERVRAKTGG